MMPSIIDQLRDNDPKVTALQCVCDVGRAFVDVVCASSTLTSLSLVVKHPERAGVSIGAIVNKNVGLMKLDLGFSVLGPDESNILASELQTNTSLMSLNLQANDLTADGGAAFGRMLRCNTSLTRLDLSCNNLPVLQALETNTTLTFLDLDWNGCDDVVGAAAVRALEINTTFTQLAIRRNAIGDEAMVSITRLLRDRPVPYDDGPAVKVALPYAY